MEPRMPFEPSADLWMLMRRIIVHNEVQLPVGWSFSVDLIEKTDELLMPMAACALTDDLAVHHVKRGKQRRRAVALVVMRHRPASAALHRQPRLRSVECLYLRLLIDRQHQRVLGRIYIEADDILNFGGEVRVVRQLEGSYSMRLQAVRRPDPLHTTMTNPSGVRHRPTGPVRRLNRRLIQRQFDDPLDHCWRQGRLATGTGCVVQQSIDAFGHKAFLPTPDCRLAFAGPPLDRHRANPIGAQQYNSSPPHVLLRAVARTHHVLQPFPITGTKPDFNTLSHPPRIAYPRPLRNPLLVPFH